MGDNLRPYDIARSRIPILPGDTLLIVPASIREDMRCRICCDIVKEAKVGRKGGREEWERRAACVTTTCAFHSCVGAGRIQLTNIPPLPLLPSLPPSLPSFLQALRECLHRFCKDCGEKALRLSNETKTMKRTGAECPLCRTNIGSKRDL